MELPCRNCEGSLKPRADGLAFGTFALVTHRPMTYTPVGYSGLFGTVLALGGLGGFFFGPRRARARAPGGVQRVEVTVRGGYSPDLIRVRQGVPSGADLRPARAKSRTAAGMSSPTTEW